MSDLWTMALGLRLGTPNGGGVAPPAPPAAPVIGLATAGNGEVSVAFSASPGATSYTVTSSPGGFTATGAGSPLVVTGLTNGTAYTFAVTATGPGGTSAPSAATGAVVPLFLWGVYPLWHHASTTPNVDGAISAIADMSLNLYPLTHGTPANQPVRGGGVITFDGLDDVLVSADATILAMGDVSTHGATLLMSLSVASNPGANAHVLGWRNGSAKVCLNVATARQTRPQKATTAASGSASPDLGTDASWIVDIQSGAEGDGLVYCNGALHQTLAVTGASPGAMTEFSIGALVAGTGAANVVARAWAVMPDSPTAGQRAEWDAYVAAGAPTRSA